MPGSRGSRATATFESLPPCSKRCSMAPTHPSEILHPFMSTAILVLLFGPKPDLRRNDPLQPSQRRTFGRIHAAVRADVAGAPAACAEGFGSGEVCRDEQAINTEAFF